MGGKMERSEHDVRVELARRIIDDAIGRVVLDPNLTDVTPADLVGVLIELARTQVKYVILQEQAAAPNGKAKGTTRRRRQAEAKATPGNHGEAGTTKRPRRPRTPPILPGTYDGGK
jgi:hypothetical protein